jgi:hypothetical protein
MLCQEQRALFLAKAGSGEKGSLLGRYCRDDGLDQ